MSPEKFSFDLLNEPSYRADMNDQFGSKLELQEDMYYWVAKAAVETIRKVNPNHLIIADGNLKGRLAVPELVPLGIGQSCRGYVPKEISHYKAEWVYRTEEIDQLPPLKWPGQVGERYLSREMLEQEYAPWIKLRKQGVGVHCGECGCYNKTPHDIFLRWFEDVVDILGSHGIGFALWNFSGAFGIVNSGREDVDYEDWYGVKLDRKLLDMIQKY
jgi:aryl-phospho-beta-D-glucosidase BglC (GH1 family)